LFYKFNFSLSFSNPQRERAEDTKRDLTAADTKRRQKEKKKKVGIDRRSPTRDVQRIERSPLYSFSFSRPQTYALFFFRENARIGSVAGRKRAWILKDETRDSYSRAFLYAKRNFKKKKKKKIDFYA
jgi:hypothetical protein